MLCVLSHCFTLRSKIQISVCRKRNKPLKWTPFKANISLAVYIFSPLAPVVCPGGDEGLPRASPAALSRHLAPEPEPLTGQTSAPAPTPRATRNLNVLTYSAFNHILSKKGLLRNHENNESRVHVSELPFGRGFLAPIGAQGVTMSVCPCGTSLSRAVNLHHSGSNL